MKLLPKNIIFFLFFTVILCIGALWILLKQNVHLGQKSSPTPSSNTLRPLPLSQWFSSLVAHPYEPYPLIATPLAAKISKSCIEVGLMRPDIKKDAIIAPFIPALCIATSETYRDPTIAKIGDFHVTVNVPTGNTSILFTIGHGLPFTIVKPEMSTSFHITVNPPYTAAIPAGQTTTDTIMISPPEHESLAIVLPKQTTITHEGAQISFTTDTSFVVALLATSSAKTTLNTLRGLEVVDSSISYRKEGNSLVTDIKLQTNTNKGFLGLYPHQQRGLASNSQSKNTVASIRGPITFSDGIQASYKRPLYTPTWEYTPHALPKRYVDQLQKDITQYIATPAPDSRSYTLGTWLGEGTTFIQLAKEAHLNKETTTLIKHISPLLFDALQLHHYDTSITSVVAQKPEYGNEKGNDHHFHYGYFIRTAAVLLREDPTLEETIVPLVTPLINDIATDSRTDNKFPRYRAFDPYESHSWADGFARFGDGNDEESSSEAIHAWYALFLWADVTKNSQLKSNALYRYSAEIDGSLCYWWNTCNVYPAPYHHEIASMVWSSKAEFATWFSNDPTMKYGIEMLPITPGSLYLTTLPQDGRYRTDVIQSGGLLTQGWGNFLTLLEHSASGISFPQFNPNAFEIRHPASILWRYLLATDQAKK